VRAPGFEPWWVAFHWTILPLDYKPNHNDLCYIWIYLRERIRWKPAHLCKPCKLCLGAPDLDPKATKRGGNILQIAARHPLLPPMFFCNPPPLIQRPALVTIPLAWVAGDSLAPDCMLSWVGSDSRPDRSNVARGRRRQKRNVALEMKPHGLGCRGPGLGMFLIFPWPLGLDLRWSGSDYVQKPQL
jgi:hypothetical protein